MLLKEWNRTKHVYPYYLCYYSLPAPVTPFSRNFIIKDNANDGRNLPSYPFTVLMTHFLDIAFVNEKARGCINEEVIGTINEAAIGAIIAPRNPPSCFFNDRFYCFSRTTN